MTTSDDAGQHNPDFLELLDLVGHAVALGDHNRAETLIAAHPGFARELSEAARTMRAIRAAARSSPAELPQSLPVALRTLGDFELLGEIGRGGMAVVYEARQISLDRSVALKVLPFAALVDERAIARFQNEVRAAALLKHPNIVTIYAVGATRGVHYYAMELVDGRSLADLVIERSRSLGRSEDLDSATRSPTASTERIHADGTSTGPAYVPSPCEWVRIVATLALQAARGLQHAHERGVLHRDVKPSNLLLDERGRLCIADFGLARIETEWGLTGTGDRVGTVRYMSPEQHAGAAVVDERTDIYSLGLTMHELVTLQPVFASPENRCSENRNDEVVPLRQVDQAVPVDFETIVRKAVERAAVDRYPSAAALADDLQRFLDHRPILAVPPKLMSRLAKAARRHRNAVAVGLGLLAVGVPLLLASLAGMALAYRVARQERGRAENHLSAARTVIDRMYDQEAALLETQPERTAAQSAFLEQADRFYSQLLEHTPDDAQSHLDCGQIALRAARVRRSLGRTDDARRSYDRAIAELAAASSLSSDVDTRLLQARCLHGISAVEFDRGHFQQALEAARGAATIVDGRLQQAPGDDDLRVLLADCHGQCGIACMLGSFPSQVDHFRLAVDLCNEVLGRAPDNADARFELLRNLENGAHLLAIQSRPEEHTTSLRKALANAEAFLSDRPSDRRAVESVASICLNLATCKSEERAMCAERAAAMFRTLTNSYPDIAAYRRRLAVSLYRLAGHQESRGDLAACRASRIEAIDLLRLLKEEKQNEVEVYLGMTLVAHARELCGGGNVVEASPYATEAFALHNRIAARTNLFAFESMDAMLNGLQCHAYCSYHVRRYADANAACLLGIQKAQEGQMRAVDFYLGRLWFQLAMSQRAQGHPWDAIRSWAKARKLFASLAPDFQNAQAACLCEMGAALSDQGQFELALAHYRQAVPFIAEWQKTFTSGTKTNAWARAASPSPLEYRNLDQYPIALCFESEAASACGDTVAARSALVQAEHWVSEKRAEEDFAAILTRARKRLSVPID